MMHDKKKKVCEQSKKEAARDETRSSSAFLFQGDLVPETESNTLRFTSYPDVSTQLTVGLFLNTQIYQSILPKNTLRVQVSSKEPALPFQCRSRYKICQWLKQTRRGD